ncbi:MAG TPA: NAD(+) synthase, partial [Ignavibacteria bacterium]|nr:NAD(+) synthase [Ignavibacteria bacterium]
VLYDISAALNAIVIGTGNKTESLLGYTTMFGDNACAINPLGDIFKTQVWELAKYLNVPESIINKAPSADLWDGQTDEDEMGIKYKEVDRYLFYRYDEKMSENELIKRGFTNDYIKFVDSIVDKNKFKRMLPIVARIYED